MAESAKRAGYDFVTLDFFGDVDQKEICMNYSLREFGEEYTLDNLLRRSRDLEFTHAVYGSGFENRPELVAELEERCILLGNPSKTLRRVRNWRRFFRVLRKENILFPRSEVVALEEAMEKSDRWLIKPLKSGGGRAIYEGREIEAGGLEEEVLLQEYISGKPASATVIGAGKSYFFIGATLQLIGDSQSKYRYVGNIAPLEAEDETLEKIKRISCRIAQAFELRGSNSIDFILKDGEPYVIEVNPRITGAMEVLEKAYDINLLKLHVRACMGRLKSLRIKPKGFFGKRILFAEKNITYKINRLDFVKDVPPYKERIKKGSPICTVLGQGKTLHGCRVDLEEKERRVRRRLGENANPG
jgi:predicted ATP-grasp superfamily ATP-dependent carboligase